ncbi:MAG: membrane protein insertase YidC [Anaerolineae bacterium]|nr:membrane protein insertase YidC [Anaerolineae bacterium]
MWEMLIQWFVLALIWLYKVLGSSEWSFALSIVVMTLLVRVLTLPFTLPSQRSMKKNSVKMQALQPELDKLKKKLRNDPQKLQQAQLDLYKEYGINPLSSMTGCLPMFIQLPIIWAFYQSISRALANQPGQMIVLSKYLANVPGFMQLVPLPSKFLWFDLGRPDMLVLPILVAGTTWLQQKLTTASTPPSADPQAAQMSQSMMITMPLMFGFFAMQMPAGLSIYFIASAVVGIGIQWLTDKLIKNDDTDVKAIQPRPAPPAPRQEPPKTKSGRRKRGYKTQD